MSSRGKPMNPVHNSRKNIVVLYGTAAGQVGTKIQSQEGSVSDADEIFVAHLTPMDLFSNQREKLNHYRSVSRILYGILFDGQL